MGKSTLKSLENGQATQASLFLHCLSLIVTKVLPFFPPNQHWKTTFYNFVKSFFYIIVVNAPSYELVLESVFVIVGSPMCSPLALPLQWFRPILCIGTISIDRVLFATESRKTSIESRKPSIESHKSLKESHLKVFKVTMYPPILMVIWNYYIPHTPLYHWTTANYGSLIYPISPH